MAHGPLNPSSPAYSTQAEELITVETWAVDAAPVSGEEFFSTTPSTATPLSLRSLKFPSPRLTAVLGTGRPDFPDHSASLRRGPAAGILPPLSEPQC